MIIWFIPGIFDPIQAIPQLIASKTGIADQIILNPKMLFSPGSVGEVVDCLKYVIKEWTNMVGLSDKGLDNVRKNFSVENNVKDLLQLYSDFMVKNKKL